MLPRFLQKFNQRLPIRRITRAQQLGLAGEERALHYLQQQGLRCVARNYRCRAGEIDLILRQQKTLIFVEVRYRTENDYGSALESITLAKRRRLLRAAKHYLLRMETLPECRFDVISLDKTQINWIQNAFTLEDI